MARTSYVQDPVTHKLIPRDEYHPSVARTHLIMPDIEPFVSVVDGKTINSRSGLNDHNQRNNVECMGDLKQKDYVEMARKKDDEMNGRTKEAKAERIEAIKHALDVHNYR